VAAEMLQILERREQGRHRPHHIVWTQTARRSISLELSKYQDVEPLHTAGVNSLDIDPVEQR
jgi:DNA excision repair protein ERCC-8